MRIWLSSLVCLLFAWLGIAQEIDFQEFRFGTSGYDKLTRILPLESGELILLGETTDTFSGWPDIYLEKINADGVTLWSRSLGTDLWDEPYAILQLENGDFLIAGGTINTSSQNHDVFVMCTNSFGQQLWFNTYGLDGSDLAVGIYPAPSGGYLVPGFTRNEEYSQAQFFMLRINENGAEISSSAVGGPADDVCRASAQDANGNILLGGYTHSNFATSQDLYLVLSDENGSVLNDFQYHSPQPVIVNDIIAEEDGFVLAGGLYSSGPSETVHPFLIKTDQTGVPQWYRAYSLHRAAEALAIVRNQPGYLLAGYSRAAPQPDGWVLQTDEFGRTLRSSTIFNRGWDELRCAALDVNGQVWVGGFSYVSTARLYDHLLITTSGVLDVEMSTQGSPIIIPREGGSFDITLQVTNQTAKPITFDLWTMVVYPDGTELAPVYSHPNLTLNPSDNYTASLTQSVPSDAMTGDYFYVVRAGWFNEFVYSEDSFRFCKPQPSRDSVMFHDPILDWEIIEEPIEILRDAPVLESTPLVVHPNPFNGMATIQFSIDHSQWADIRVFDVLGREVVFLHRGILGPGPHEFTLNAETLSSGLYFVIVDGQDETKQTYKVMVLR